MTPDPTPPLRAALEQYRERIARADGEREPWKRFEIDVASRIFATASAEHLPAALSALDASRAESAQDASALHAIAMNTHRDCPLHDPGNASVWREGHRQARHDIAEAISAYFAERLAAPIGKAAADAAGRTA